MTQKTKTQNNMPFTFDAFRGLIDDQLARIQTYTEEAARYEKQGLEQAGQAIDEMSRLMKDSLEYTSKLTAEWRRVAIEAGHKASDMINQTLAN